MKASAKLRDGQEPLLRAKIPMDILGARLWSGVSMGSRDELGLHLSTMLGAGPSCRVTYLPNDSLTPITVMFKAGLGPWGSPTGSCLAISAQLKLPTSWPQLRPSFSISVKPRSGDFVLLKSVKGLEFPKRGPTACPVVDEDTTRTATRVAELAKVFENPRPHAAVEDDWVFPESTTPAFLQGWNVAAKSMLPLGQRLCAGFRWRMEVPGEVLGCVVANPHKALSRLRLPVLKLDKISIHGKDGRDEDARAGNRMGEQVWTEESEELNKVAVMCSSIRRQLHLVYSENRVLRNTMEEMRTNFNGRSNVEVATPPYVPVLPRSSAGNKEAPSDLNQRMPRMPDAPPAPAPTPPAPVPAPVASPKKPVVSPHAIAKELSKAVNASKST